MLKRLEAGGIIATAGDQEELARYCGWGGLPQAFDTRNVDWAEEVKELAALLTEDEYEAARQSTQDAHYTPVAVIDAIYAGLHRAGFRGGRVLEPGLGTGRFVGRMPDDLRAHSKVVGIERDAISARIARALYPSAEVIARSFQDVNVPDGWFDAMVGNPPFGEQSVFDAAHPELSRWSIHNYFVAKALEKVAPGGMMGFAVSRYFLDGADESVRSHIAERAHLRGAFRLPVTAFKESALTEVTTDVIFLQRAKEGETPDRSWVTLGRIDAAEVPDGIAVNRWFIEHPETLLGTMALGHSRFGPAPMLKAVAGRDWEVELARGVRELVAEGIARADQMQEKVEALGEIVVPEDVKVGGYFVLEDGRIGMRLPDVLDKTAGRLVAPPNTRAGERIRGMVKVRRALRALMRAEADAECPEGVLSALRTTLNEHYDAFTRAQGFINGLANKQAMDEDPEFPLLQALEVDYSRGISREAAKKTGEEPCPPSAGKAAIFRQRVVMPMPVVERVDTAEDALSVSLNMRGRVDLGFMCRLSSLTEGRIADELKGRIFRNPATREWEPRDRYLTGNVKEKLSAAIAAAATDPGYAANVDALAAVQPPPIKAVDIGIELGAPWVPEHVVREFVQHLLGDVRCTVAYVPEIGRWVADIGRGSHAACAVEWGTAEMPANMLIGRILTNSPVQVMELAGHNDRGMPVYRLNAEKTAAAEGKAAAVKSAFQDWIWRDEERRKELEKIYNDRFNTNVGRRYDGSHLSLPGASPLIELRPQQKNAIWRGLIDGGELIDHEVGAGKTYVMVGIAMELRRMGLKRKPMLVVPNNVLFQWRDAFQALYPSANVLVAEESDFEKANRERLFGRIATGDWDAVIVPHSSFKRIPLPQATFEAILKEQIDDLTNAIVRLKTENGPGLSIKELAKARDRMEARLDRVSGTGRKDRAVDFADLGVDALLVDELDEFKNLFITTTLTRVAGLGNLEGSEKAFDLFVKARHVHRTYGKTGFYGATGTPISNTIAEVYTLQRYFQYEDLVERGLVHFDAWARTFGVVTGGWELDATGVNYRQVSRFAKFQGVPELTAMYRTFADVITQQDLDEQEAKRGARPMVPRIKGGKATNVVVERSGAQARYMGVKEPVLDGEGRPVLRGDGSAVLDWNPGSIIWRMANLPDDPRRDNPLKVTNDARKAGLDFRLADPDADDFAGSKVNAAVENIHRIWKQWEAQRGTQLVFCDLSTPKGKRHPGESATPAVEAEGVSMDDLLAAGHGFSVYEDLKAKLIAKGIPGHEIRFIHEANTNTRKGKLYEDMNAGRARVLVGSTFKMGAGTNVQRRLVAKHDLDCPWRPRDVTQRDGRARRQGNLFHFEDPEFEIELYRYATRGMYDARMWQTVEIKARAIEQFRRGDMLERVIEDVASEAANFAEMKAAASGNPLVLVQVELAAKLRVLEAMYANHQRGQHAMEDRLSYLRGAEKRLEVARQRLMWDIECRNRHSADSAEFVASSGQRFEAKARNEAGGVLTAALGQALKAGGWRGVGTGEDNVAVGTYRGFEIRVKADPFGFQFIVKGGGVATPDNLRYGRDEDVKTGGLFRRIDNYLGTLEDVLLAKEKAAGAEVRERQAAEVLVGKPFQEKVTLELVRKDVADVNRELRLLEADPEYVSCWLPVSIEAPAEMREAVMAGNAVQKGVAAAARRLAERFCSDIEHAGGEAEQLTMAWASVEATIGGEGEIRSAFVERLREELEQRAAVAKEIARAPLARVVPVDLLEVADEVTGIAQAVAEHPAKDRIEFVRGAGNMAFSGTVVGVAESVCFQEIGRGAVVAHRLADLRDLGAAIRIGDSVRIQYHGSGGAIVRKGRDSGLEIGGR